MKRFSISIAVLSAAIIPCGGAQAMEIRQFDKMADHYQSEYIGNLIVGAENALTDEGKTDFAAQIKHLFTTKDSGDADVIGMVEFERNLALARVADAERAEKDPSAHRVHVEDAMLLTLQKNHIPMSRIFVTAFRSINIGFRSNVAPLAAPPSHARTAPPVASRPVQRDDDDPIGSGGFITPPKR